MNASQVLSSTAKFCYNNLLSNKDALEYACENRKFTAETLKHFELGLFPTDMTELFKFVDPKTLREANIVKNASKSVFRTWDLVVPIKDVYGNYIAMAGRLRISEEERQKKDIPKYINSVYKKSQHLFGLDFAKQDIIKKDVVYVVEGLLDVIMAHQNNITNVVGVCGKYLSIRQVALLSRYTDKIVLILDNEPEAQLCAQKTIERRCFAGLSITAKNPFPDSIKDLDQFLKEKSRQEVLSALESRDNYAHVKPLWG
jgi:DNA primase